MSGRKSVWALALTLAAAPGLNGASISLLDIFKNVVYTQNSAAAPSTPASFFADVELTSAAAGDFDNVNVSFPGPASPVPLDQISPVFFNYGPGFATAADMNTAIPFGTYTFAASNSGTSATQTEDLTYTADAFTSAIPTVNAALFSSFDPSQNLTIGFNGFTPAANASEGFTFLRIFTTSGTLVFNQAFLSPATTSALLPANTLLANTAYNFELDFSDRIDGSNLNGVPTLIGSDVRTDGGFVTGAIAVSTPEPGTLLSLGAGLFAILLSRRRATR